MIALHAPGQQPLPMQRNCHANLNADHDQLGYTGLDVKGYIAVTDHGWYQHLLREPEPLDANFWRPSTRAVRLDPGTPFIFKLKAPHRAVAGFGYFASFTVLPDWLAWETFGQANGVSGLQALQARLAKIRASARIQADAAGRIGCCLIAEATIFAEEDWVPAPRDWKPRTQSGAGYDLSTGEGRRVWQQCLERAARPRSSIDTASTDRFGEAVHRPRLGQGIFRVQVLDAYGRACAVTRERSLPVIEAAHIKPYAFGGEHDIQNGLALRTDIHRPFDRGYVTIDDDHRFVVGRRLKDEFDNGRSYYGLHGTTLELPANSALVPSRRALRWHQEHVFMQ